MAADPIANLLDADGRPRWELLQREPICSRCGYNLTLLERPRCPECGFEFAWRDVAEAASRNRNEDWLFEYAWRKRPVRSLVITCWRALWPWSFWRRLSIHDPIRPGALVCLLAVVAVLHWLATAVFILVYVVTQWVRPLSWVGLWTLEWSTLLAASASGALAMTFQWCALVGLWLVAVGGLRQTMGRCRVRFVQVLRVTTYTAAPFVLYFCVLNHLVWWVHPYAPFRWSGPTRSLVLYSAVDLALWSVMAAMGAKPLGPGYLKLPHHRWIATVMSFVAILTVRVGWCLLYIGY